MEGAKHLLLLVQTWWPWCFPLPSSKIMPKHDEDMGGIGNINISRQLGLVRIYLSQWPIQTHDYALQNSPFRKRVRPSAAWRIIVNKIKVCLFLFKKLHCHVAEIVSHRETLGNRTHLLIWSCWKPAARGDHGVGFFFLGVLLLCVAGCVVHEVMVG